MQCSRVKLLKNHPENRTEVKQYQSTVLMINDFISSCFIRWLFEPDRVQDYLEQINASEILIYIYILIRRNYDHWPLVAGSAFGLKLNVVKHLGLRVKENQRNIEFNDQTNWRIWRGRIVVECVFGHLTRRFRAPKLLANFLSLRSWNFRWTKKKRMWTIFFWYIWAKRFKRRSKRGVEIKNRETVLIISVSNVHQHE